MISVRLLLRSAVMRFLPTLVGVMVTAVFVVEGLLSGSGLRSLQRVNWWVFALEVGTITAGFFVALLPLLKKLEPGALESRGRHVGSAGCALFGLGVVSAFAQGVGVEAIVTFSFGAGIIAALPMLWPIGKGQRSVRSPV